MADNQLVDNNQETNYTVETEDQGGGIHRQVVKVAELTGSITSSLPTVSSVTESKEAIVTATSTEVLAASATRKFGWLQNISDTTMYVSFSGTATQGEGTEVQANGGVLTLMGGWGVVQTAVSVIHAGGANKDILVVSG